VKIGSISGLVYSTAIWTRRRSSTDAGFGRASATDHQSLCYVTVLADLHTDRDQPTSNRGSGPTLYLKVDDIDRLLRRRARHGLTPSGEAAQDARDAGSSCCSTPDGNKLASSQ